MNKLYVGLDLSLKDFKVSLSTRRCCSTKPFAATNDLYGSQVLIEAIESCCRRLDASTVFIGFESTSYTDGTYSTFWPILRPLSPIIRISFALTQNHRRFKESLGNLPKTIMWMQIQLRKGLDSVDSQVLPCGFQVSCTSKAYPPSLSYCG